MHAISLYPFHILQYHSAASVSIRASDLFHHRMYFSNIIRMRKYRLPLPIGKGGWAAAVAMQSQWSFNCSMTTINSSYFQQCLFTQPRYTSWRDLEAVSREVKALSSLKFNFRAGKAVPYSSPFGLFIDFSFSLVIHRYLTRFKFRSHNLTKKPIKISSCLWVNGDFR